MEKMIPLIGSSEAGPLGAIHLPRFWSKVLMSAKGMLHDDYDECGTGFDQMVLDGLGLDRQKTLDYLKASLPSYPQFEQWVLEQKGGSMSQSVIEKSNQAIIDTCIRARTFQRSRKLSERTQTMQSRMPLR